MTGESGAGTGVGGLSRCRSRVRQILLDAFVTADRRWMLDEVSPVRCWAGRCLSYGEQQHWLGEALDAADEFGA
jgi:hypothetical protein